MVVCGSWIWRFERQPGAGLVLDGAFDVEMGIGLAWTGGEDKGGREGGLVKKQGETYVRTVLYYCVVFLFRWVCLVFLFFFFFALSNSWFVQVRCYGEEEANDDTPGDEMECKET